MESIKKKKLILFGSLFLSAERVKVTWIQAIRNNGLNPDCKIIYDNATESFKETIIPILAERGGWTDAQVSQIINDAKDLFKENDEKYLNELGKRLVKLKERGYHLGIVTESPHDFLVKRMGKLGINPDGFFSFVKTGDEEIKKPDPRVLTSCLESFSNEEILMVGHSRKKDLALAKRSKIDFVAITVVHPEGSFLADGIAPGMIYPKVTDFIDALIN